MADHISYPIPDVLFPVGNQQPDWMQVVDFNTKSDGWESSVGAKGLSTSTQPIEEVSVTHSAVKLPSFTDDFYNRILIEPSYIDAGSLVTDQFYTISIWNGYFQEYELQNLTILNEEGLALNGPSIPHTWGMLETVSYQLSISSDGPPSISSSLTFDFNNVGSDISVTIVGQRIVMLPYQASIPWTETLEWKTNVLTTNSGKEQRIRLRKAGRQTLKGNYPIPASELSRSFNMVYGWLQRKWAVAVWSESQLVGGISAGASAIACNTANYDFRSNSLIAIWESETHNDVIELLDVANGILNLKRPLGATYSNAIIMPVRLGMITGGIDRSTNGYKSSLNMAYEVTDNKDLALAAPLQFLGYDIYFDGNLVGDSGGGSEKITTRLDIVDYETGVSEYFSPWLYNRRARTVSYINEGAQECWNFKKWLHRRAGRLRPYWIPTFENNLRLKMEGFIGSTLTVIDDAYRSLGKLHDHIAIRYTSGAWVARTITGSSINDGETINVAIDSPLLVDSSAIDIISFLTFNRLDTDRAEIEWLGNNVNQCNLRTLEIKP